MSLKNLTEKEKNILMQLSYLDIPPKFEVSETKPRNIHVILNEIEESGIDVDNERMANIQAYLEENKNSPLHSIKVTGYDNNNPNEANNSNGKSESGLVAYSIKDSDGNGAVLFRGSESMGDWDHIKTDWTGNVIAGIGIETQQHKEAMKFYDAHMADVSGHITIYGHSKGGNISSHVYVNNYGEKVDAYVVNGAPLWWFSLTDDQKEALKGDSFTFITYEGDFVSHLGYAPYVDKIVKLNKNHGDYANPFYPHYETSVDFNPDGSFVSTRGADEWMITDIARDLYYSIGSTVAYIGNTLVDWGRDTAVTAINWAREAAMVVSSAALNIVYNTYQGMVNAANYVRDQALQFISRLQNFGRDLVADARRFFDTVAQSTRSIISRAIKFITGGSNPVEPFIRVDVSRLYYYSNRLRALQRRTQQLRDMIDDLYLEAGILGLDNVLKADISLSFDGRIPDSIAYLNRTAELLDRNERYLAGMANTLK
ncbi:DUF2974 domain-containing protein [Bacillus sp. REN3]|uniref:DUF2974 domain-containing protein n=1 Tax=Bacillus sp. REN3 TaxID=2802440 RepID=UPI001AEDCBCC|nr:DUF2974 domain-containing protein [Bacillus sp. REN3]